MHIRDDDRGQIVQLGVVFMLGLLVVVMSVYQASVVPQENKEIEFAASEQARADVSELRNAIIETAVTGTRTGTTVKTGAQYPSRVLFVNPPPPNGRLRTTDAQNVSVSNARATDGDIDDYWNGQRLNFSSKTLVFAPNYNEFDAAPIRIVGGFAYRNYSGRILTETAQPFVRGNRITLVTLAGDLQAGGYATAVTSEPVSASTRTVTVTGDSGPFNVTIPTEIPADAWRETILAAEYDPDSDASDRYVKAVTQDGPQAVTITFEGDATYELALAKVAVSESDQSGVSTPTAHYLVAPLDAQVNTGSDSRAKLVVEARDRFNNPRSNANVTVEAAAGRFETRDGEALGENTATVRTNENGRAIVWYNASDEYGVHDVTAFLGDDADSSLPDRQQVTYDVVHSGTGTQGTSGNDASNIVVFEGATESAPTGQQQYEAVNVTLRNAGSASLNVSGVRLGFVTQHEKAERASDSATVTDGPNAVESVKIVDGGQTVASESVIARETSAPAFFDSDQFSLPPDEERGLVLTFDQSFQLRNEEAISLSVTVYYEGGLSATYSLYLFG